MRTINLVGICSMALMLAATAFSAGCTTDSGGEGGAGGESPTTTTTTTTGGEGGNGEGGNGEGGNGEGGSGACVTCSAPLVDGADPEMLCEDSAPLYVALTDCICEACEACADSCDPESDVEPSDACLECGTEVATTEGEACFAEGSACLADE